MIAICINDYECRTLLTKQAYFCDVNNKVYGVKIA